MHELGIATNIVEIVENEISRHHYGRVRTIALRIGAMTDIDHDSLQFGFVVITKGTQLENAQLAIEPVPISISCSECHRKSEVERFQFICSFCGSRRVELVHGTELEIAYLEIDDESDVRSEQLQPGNQI